MSEETLFSKIIKGEIPCDKVFENDRVLAFKDIHPQAPIHVLFIHKKYSKNINQMMAQEPQQIIDLMQAVREYTSSQGLEEAGFRLVTNVNRDGGQTVFHTHFHLLAGAPLGGFGTRS